MIRVEDSSEEDYPRALREVQKPKFSAQFRNRKVVAALKLISAIREQAEADGMEHEFEEYWLQEPQWARLWDQLEDYFEENRGKGAERGI